MQYDEAEREIQAFIDANPNDPTPFELLGEMLSLKGLPQDAIPMFQKAHRLRPGDIYMAAENTAAGLRLDDENLTSQWLNEARTRGADGRWTRSAENQVMYAYGDFDGLLKQVDGLLESLPGQTLLIAYKARALMNLGETDLAEETLQLAMESNGYVIGQSLPGNLLYLSLQLANAYDHDGNTSDRDLLLGDIKTLLQQLRETESFTSGLLFISASVESIENDLPGVLRELESAVESGFRNHWELIRDPVFKRWQKHPEFIAFHQGMLDAAARMRAEYYANNPAEQTATALEGGL
jgi:tetratricopeptide (TPR) repeat protein